MSNRQETGGTGGAIGDMLDWEMRRRRCWNPITSLKLGSNPNLMSHNYLSDFLVSGHCDGLIVSMFGFCWVIPLTAYQVKLFVESLWH